MTEHGKSSSERISITYVLSKGLGLNKIHIYGAQRTGFPGSELFLDEVQEGWKRTPEELDFKRQKKKPARAFQSSQVTE